MPRFLHAGLIHAQNDVSRSYKEIILGLEKRLRQIEVDFVNFRENDNT